MELITLLRYFLWSFKASLHAFFASKFPVMSPKIWICSSTVLKINVDRKKKKKQKAITHTEKETFTTSSRPLASFKNRLFLVARTLATRKTARELCWFLYPVFTFFLSNFPHFFSILPFVFCVELLSAEALDSSYDEKMFGLYSMAHINWNQILFGLKISQSTENTRIEPRQIRRKIFNYSGLSFIKDSPWMGRIQTLYWFLLLTSHRYNASTKENSLRKSTISIRNANRYSPPSRSSAKQNKTSMTMKGLFWSICTYMIISTLPCISGLSKDLFLSLHRYMCPTSQASRFSLKYNKLRMIKKGLFEVCAHMHLSIHYHTSIGLSLRPCFLSVSAHTYILHYRPLSVTAEIAFGIF